jgi:hypothetical protein
MLVVLISGLPYLKERHVFSQVQARICALSNIELEESVCEENRAKVSSICRVDI